MSREADKPTGGPREPLPDAEVLARLAANLVHDLKNLVNPLSLYLQLLERQIGRDNAQARVSLAEMNEVVAQSMVVLDRLRDFSRQTPAKLVEPATMNEVVAEVADTLRARASSSGGEGVEVVTELGEAVLVEADRAGLATALADLANNALDALDGGGGSIVLRTGVADGHAWVTVTDDGPGMEAAVLERAFEPLFSTKGTLGAGLGLSNVYAFAKRRQGKVPLSTQPGEGTTVRLELPLAELPDDGPSS